MQCETTLETPKTLQNFDKLIYRTSQCPNDASVKVSVKDGQMFLCTDCFKEFATVVDVPFDQEPC